MSWFECKVKYQKMDQEGKEKMVSEPYLIDAMSFTEAEARIHEQLEPYITGEFHVINIKRANYSELVPNDSGDRWFKVKLTFIILDEEKGKERRSNTYMLVQANNVKETYDIIEESMRGTASDYAVPAIQESPIMDVFPYDYSDQQEKEQDISNLTPMSDIEEENDDV